MCEDTDLIEALLKVSYDCPFEAVAFLTVRNKKGEELFWKALCERHLIKQERSAREAGFATEVEEFE